MKKTITINNERTDRCDSCGKVFPVSQLIHHIDPYCHKCWKRIAVGYLEYHHARGERYSKDARALEVSIHTHNLLATSSEMSEKEKDIQKALGLFPKIMCTCGRKVFEDDIITTPFEFTCPTCRKLKDNK